MTKYIIYAKYLQQCWANIKGKKYQFYLSLDWAQCHDIKMIYSSFKKNPKQGQVSYYFIKFWIIIIKL